MPRHVLRVILASAIPVLLASCDSDDAGRCTNVGCAPCPPDVLIAVRDSVTKDVVASAVLAGVSGVECQSGMCEGDLAFGTYTATISAPGYADKLLAFDVSEPTPDPTACCAPCVNGGLHGDVLLTPL